MIAVTIYFAAIVVANLSIVAIGPWVSPLNAFLLIGLDLTLRDHLHDSWQGRQLWPRMLGLIAAAGAASYLLNPAAGVIAIASVASFCAAAVVDSLVYQAMRRKGFLARSNCSNAAGSAADRVLFPTIAFGAPMPEIVFLQFAAKVGGGFLWSLIIQRAKSAKPA